uniref:Uncharacterized protein n=1 Tax=Rhizophora mucronata TaxID=61149 RepID=A0A2P2QDF9_RHIMU
MHKNFVLGQTNCILSKNKKN